MDSLSTSDQPNFSFFNNDTWQSTVHAHKNELTETNNQ